MVLEPELGGEEKRVWRSLDSTTEAGRLIRSERDVELGTSVPQSGKKSASSRESLFCGVIAVGTLDLQVRLSQLGCSCQVGGDYSLRFVYGERSEQVEGMRTRNGDRTAAQLR